MIVSIFGGSQMKEGSPAYAEAEWLGNALAGRGHTVLTGGYMGAMEAVSRGAAEAGGHVVGVTCVEIEHWHHRAANRWVAEERKRGTLVERLQSLIEDCDAAMALPGGPGTLTEISLMWNLMIVGALGRKPLILIGAAWRSVFDELITELGEYTPQPQREMLIFATDAKAAIESLTQAA
jgi:hypothetical protein